MKFVVDLDLVEGYTDSNGVTWDDTIEKYSLYSGLVGNTFPPLKVVKVFEHDGVLKAHVESDGDLTGYYLSPRMTGFISEGKKVTEVDYASIDLLDPPICKEYSVEGLRPCRLIGDT